jgi:hypothetical protein
VSEGVLDTDEHTTGVTAGVAALDVVEAGRDPVLLLALGTVELQIALQALLPAGLLIDLSCGSTEFVDQGREVAVREFTRPTIAAQLERVPAMDLGLKPGDHAAPANGTAINLSIHLRRVIGLTADRAVH